MNKKITILIADAQFLIRAGLRHLLERFPEFEVVGEATQEPDLRQVLFEKRPDVLVMDHDQSASFNQASIETVRNLSPGTQILVISSDNDKSSIYQILEQGVSSFLTKTCGEEEILDAIRATARGEKFFCTRIIDYLLEKSFAKSPEEEEDCRPTPLTPREMEIVRLIAKGLIAKEIANTLNLSTHTVYTHRKNIMRKLELNSSSELVLYAVNNGIVERDLL